MIWPLFLHLAIWAAASVVAGTIFRGWTRSKFLPPSLARWAGASVLLGLLFLLVKPLLLPSFGSLWVVEHLSRQTDYLGLLALVGILGICLSQAVFRTLRIWSTEQKLRGLALDPGKMIEAGGDWAMEEAFRSSVEVSFREDLQLPRLRLIYLAHIPLPRTTGWFRPTIQIPHWMLRTDEAKPYCKVLLNHEREKIRMGLHRWIGLLRGISIWIPPFRLLAEGLIEAIRVEVDRRVLAHSKPASRDRYLDALAKLGAADPALAQVRVRQALGSARNSLLSPAALGLCICIPWFSGSWVGPIDWKRHTLLLTFQWVRPYQRPAGLEFRRLVGQGGDMGDGLLIDTFRVKNQLDTLFGFYLPLDPPKTGHVRLEFDWRLTRNGSSAPLAAWMVRLMHFPKANLNQSQVLDLDTASLEGGSGRACLEVLHQPKPQDAWGISYPVMVGVPAGCQLEIRNLRLTQIHRIPRPKEEQALLRERDIRGRVARFQMPPLDTRWTQVPLQ